MSEPLTDLQKPFVASIIETLGRSKFTNRVYHEDMNELPAYVALTKCINDILKMVGPDSTEQAFPNVRTGILLESYINDSIFEEEPTLQHVLTLAQWYEQSYPGYPYRTGFEVEIKRSSDPGKFRRDEFKIRRSTNFLSYRLRLTNMATSYKNFLGIPFANCQDIDANSEFHKLKFATGKDEEKATHIRKCYERVMLLHPYLFDAPKLYQGDAFVKMAYYLALVLYSTKWTYDEMETALVQCAKYRKRTWMAHRTITPLVLAQNLAIPELLMQLEKEMQLKGETQPKRETRLEEEIQLEERLQNVKFYFKPRAPTT